MRFYLLVSVFENFSILFVRKKVKNEKRTIIVSNEFLIILLRKTVEKRFYFILLFYYYRIFFALKTTIIFVRKMILDIFVSSFIYRKYTIIRIRENLLSCKLILKYICKDI